MGHVVCSCGWKKEANTCSEAEGIIKKLSFRCPNCLFTGIFKYVHE